MNNLLSCWFDKDGYVGQSEYSYFEQDKFTVVRKYKDGEKLVLTYKE